MEDRAPDFRSRLVSDEALAASAQEGRDAFMELYDRYVGRVESYLFARLGRSTDVEDLVSAIFERALTHIASYQAERGRFATWLFAIARNIVNDHLRRGRRVQIFSGIPAGIGETRPGPEDEIIRRESDLAVRRAMMALTDLQRDALAGLSYAETALALGKSEAAAKMLVRRGLVALRVQLSEEDR